MPAHSVAKTDNTSSGKETAAKINDDHRTGTLQFLHLPLLLSGRHTLQNPPHVIFVSDLYGAAQSVIDPATEAIQIIGRFRGGVNSVTHIASIRPELECMSSSEIDHWIQGASTIFNGWKSQLARTTNIGERTLLQGSHRRKLFTSLIWTKTESRIRF